MAGMDHIVSKAFLAQSAATSPLVFGQVVQQVAGTNLDPNQAQLMPLVTALAVAADIPLGVCMENLDLVKMQTGKAYFQVALNGNIDVIYGGTGLTAPFASVAPYANGYVVPSGSGTGGTPVAGQVMFIAPTATFRGLPVLGRCLGSAGDIQAGLPVAQGDLFKIQLTPGLIV